jgi:hypothetical protein
MVATKKKEKEQNIINDNSVSELTTKRHREREEKRLEKEKNSRPTVGPAQAGNPEPSQVSIIPKLHMRASNKPL